MCELPGSNPIPHSCSYPLSDRTCHCSGCLLLLATASNQLGHHQRALAAATSDGAAASVCFTCAVQKNNNNSNNNWKQKSLSAATTASCKGEAEREGIIIWFMRLANGKCCCYCRRSRISATHTHNKDAHTINTNTQ